MNQDAGAASRDCSRERCILLAKYSTIRSAPVAMHNQIQESRTSGNIAS